MRAKQHFEALRSPFGLAAGAGVAVPALAFFTELDAPILPGSGILAGAFATAAWLFAMSRRLKKSELRRAARTRLVGAIILVLTYILLYDLTTVRNPIDGSAVQIGFGLAPFSLTPDDRLFVAENPGIRERELMGRRGGFEDGGVYEIWIRGWVYVAGVVVLLLIVGATTLWTSAWAYMARIET